MLAFIENFQLSEGILIAIVAVLIFGKRLPQVAGQAAAHVGRARRSLNELWRESGLEEEMRKVQREVDRARSPFAVPRRVPEPTRPRLPAPPRGAGADAAVPEPVDRSSAAGSEPPEPRAPAADDEPGVR